MMRTSDDDMPLCSLRDNNSYNSLCQRAWKRCEFCEEVFSTRLANIKHNASHIIIPLLKLTLHQCEECLFHFTSLDDLRTHATSKNHETSQLNTHKAGYEELLQSIVEKQLVVKCHDTFKISSPELKVEAVRAVSPDEVKSILKINSRVKDVRANSPEQADSTDDEVKRILKNSPVKDNRADSPEVKSIKAETPIEISSDSDRSSPTEVLKNDSNFEKGSSPDYYSRIEKNSSPDIKDSQCELPIESVRSRIMFEDDFDDDLFEAEEILPDKPYYPPKNSYIIGSVLNKSDEPRGAVKLDIDVPIIGSILKSDEPRGTVKLDIKVPLIETIKKLNGVTSVHYSELVAPEICDCRYCGRCFANRFQLIKHESTHMQVSRTLPILCYVCEKYLPGNHWTLRRHLKNYHPTQERKMPIYKCSYCHLNYHNYDKHVKLYHIVTCKECNRRVDRKKFKDHHCYLYEPEVNESIVKLCEMCLTFTKNRLNIHYEVIGEFSQIGKRQQCDKCLTQHFEVKLVKRKVKARVEGEIKKRRPLSNQERLQKMRNRLKMIKQMNKC